MVTKYNKKVLFITVQHTAFYFPADIWAMVSVEIWKKTQGQLQKAGVV